MEISIINKSLEKSSCSLSNERLNILLNEIKSNSIRDIIRNGRNYETNIQIKHIIDEIDNLESEDEQIKVTSNFISTMRYYLKKGINESDIKFISMFLYANMWMKIEINDLLSANDVNSEEFLIFLEYTKKFLQKCKIHPVISEKTPYHQKNSYKKYKKGLTTNNIDFVYDFVKSLERGKGIYSNYIIHNLSKILFEFDFDKFLEVISNKNGVIDLIGHLQCYNTEELFNIADYLDNDNLWLHFELLRQILKKTPENSIDEEKMFHLKNITKKSHENSIDEEKMVCVKNIIKKLYEYDFDFFKQTVTFFQNNYLFNASLGENLAELDKSIIKNIFEDCFKIDSRDDNIESKTILLKRFKTKSTDDNYKYLLKIVFNIWNGFFNESLVSNELLNVEIIRTDYWDYIVDYYIYSGSEKILSELYDLASKIKFIDSEWSYSQITHINKLNLYFSKMYLLSYAYKYKQLTDSKFFRLYLELNKDDFLLKMTLRRNDDFFKKMDDNFDYK